MALFDDITGVLKGEQHRTYACNRSGRCNTGAYRYTYCGSGRKAPGQGRNQRGLIVFEKGKEVMAEMQEVVEDLIAESKSELAEPQQEVVQTAGIAQRALLMLPDAYLSHQTSGRIRVKIPSKKGDDSYFKNANALLQQHKGIDRTEVNPLTGSILIIHSGNSTSVMKIAETNKLFRLNGANQTPTVAAGIKTTFNDFNTQVKG